MNASGEITALDALLIINRLNRAAGNTVPVNPTDQGPNYFDVNGNGEITALDALLVINRIGQSAAAGEGESLNPPASGQLESVQRASTQPVLGLPASAPRVSADDARMRSPGSTSDQPGPFRRFTRTIRVLRHIGSHGGLDRPDRWVAAGQPG